MMMMMSSAVGRRTLLSKSTTTAFRRPFSTGLLVPIQSSTMVAPAEVENCHISEYAHNQLQLKYAEFNDACKAELQEMNKNIIENIVNRGGTQGWEIDNDAMTKSFEFNSFEQAQAFVMRVATDAEKKDHHPEWSLSAGGKTVNVKLTSHFANNTVTRLDFEIAECMNTANDEIVGSFKMYPMFSKSEWVSMKLGFGMFVLGVFAFKFMTGTNHEQTAQPAGTLPSTEYKSAVAQFSPVQALADTASDRAQDPSVLSEEVIEFAYGEYEKKGLDRPISGM